MKIRALVLAVIMTLTASISSLTAIASESKTQESKNIIEMTNDERNKYFSDLVRNIVNNNTREININSEFIDYEVLLGLTRNMGEGKYVKSNELGIMRNVIDFINVDKSSDNDLVAMCNVQLAKAGYNVIYLFEFHINQSGEIYGYNIWHY